MSAEKLQLELYRYIISDRRIEELEEKKAQAIRRKEAAEITERCLVDPKLKETAVAAWNEAYREELKLEIKILTIKKEQAEFLLERMLAD